MNPRIATTSLAVLLLAACKPAPQEAQPLGTKPLAVTWTGTPIPAPATTAATITPSVTKGPTLTPLPTLAPSDAAIMIQRLLEGNAACNLPCWWGIEPGRTEWNTASHFIAQFAFSIGRGGTEHRADSHGVAHVYESWTVDYVVPGETKRGFVQFSLVDGKVSVIRVGPVGTQISYSIGKLLQTLGQPRDIRIWGEQIGDGSWPFGVLLYYPQQGVLAHFPVIFRRSGSQLSGCVSDPNLYLLDPEGPMQITDLRPLGAATTRALTLEEASEVSIDTFFKEYSGKLEGACFHTSANLWK